MNTDTELLRKLVELAREVSDTDPFEAPTSVEKAAIGQFVLEHIPQLMALSRLLEAQAGWQPIETAPKDKYILMLSKRGWIEIAKWSDEAAFGRFEIRQGWQIIECEDDWYSQAWEPNEVTHWMPLPHPPSEGEPQGTAEQQQAAKDKVDPTLPHPAAPDDGKGQPYRDALIKIQRICQDTRDLLPEEYTGEIYEIAEEALSES